MSRRNKLQKFADLYRYPNVLENFDKDAGVLHGENGALCKMAGKWHAVQFGNDHPITLELACGRGEYTVSLARMYPDQNFIGVDIKGARIWKGATIALDEGLHNAAFLRTRIEWMDQFFAPGEISSIWITFPDPFLRKSKVNRRLTAPVFLRIYRKVLVPGGLVHLKTDAPELYAFTLETLAADPQCRILYTSGDIYAKPLAFPELAIKTRYERAHIAEQRKIRYIRFTINQAH